VTKSRWASPFQRDQFLSSLDKAAQDAAAEQGIDLTSQDAQKDVQKQIDQIATFASQGCKAIIVNPVEIDTADALISAAGGVPVFFVNRLPDESVFKEGIAYGVGSDELQSGGFQGEFLAGYFADRTDKTLNVAILQGIIGHPATNKRTDSALQGLKDAGFTVNEVFKDTAEFDRAKAMQLIQTFLGTGKPVDVIVANNDEMALGAIEALKAVGKTTKDVPVVGIDATSEGVASIAAGDLNASVFQDAVGQGAGALEAAAKVVTGEKVDLITWIPFKLVTPENVADYQ
jgi:ABC-type sugar transport system substrate-binding protein